MAKRKRILKSNGTDLGSRKQTKQTQLNELITKQSVHSQDIHASPDLDCQKITHNTLSQPSIFHHSLKYVHKKFKRIAEIEDNHKQVEKSNALSNITNDNAVTQSQSHANKTEVINLSKNNGSSRNIERLTEEENKLNEQCRSANRVVRTSNCNSELTSNGSSQSTITAIPLSSLDTVADDDTLYRLTTQLKEKPQHTSFISSPAKNDSMPCQGIFGTTSSTVSFKRPYKPKFHNDVSISMAFIEKNGENSLLNLCHHNASNSIDSGTKPIDTSQSCNAELVLRESDSILCSQREPLNLTISSNDGNRRDLSTIVSMPGNDPITSNLQNSSHEYLDTPLPSPGPLLGKTRLVDNYLNKLDHLEINNAINRIDSKKNETTKKHLVMTKPENRLSPSSTTELFDSTKVYYQSEFDTFGEITSNSVKCENPPKNPVSMQTTEVSSSVKTLSIAKVKRANEYTAKKEIVASNTASHHLELANKQENSAHIDDHRATAAKKKTKQKKRLSVMSFGSDALLSAPLVSVDKDGLKSNSSRLNISYIQKDDGPLRCTLCSSSFLKSSQLKMHMNIHYMSPEQKFHCDSCGKSFRTQNRLQKHVCFVSKDSKVPRPFECSDCSIAFRIHGHLAKHLRSKSHIQNLENIQKLPSGTYALIERALINLGDIDTTNCDISLNSIKELAGKLKISS